LRDQNNPDAPAGRRLEGPPDDQAVSILHPDGVIVVLATARREAFPLLAAVVGHEDCPSIADDKRSIDREHSAIVKLRIDQ
jgi:hypothetical protein